MIILLACRTGIIFNAFHSKHKVNTAQATHDGATTLMLQDHPCCPCASHLHKNCAYSNCIVVH